MQSYEIHKGACYYPVLFYVFKGGDIGVTREDRGGMEEELKGTEGWLEVNIEKCLARTGHTCIAKLRD